MKVPYITIAAIVVSVFSLNAIKGYVSNVVTNKLTTSVITEIAEETESNSVEDDIVKNVPLNLEAEVKEYVSPINFNDLKEINNDVVSYIKIGENVSYPVLYDGTDKYLDHDIYGNKSASGAIYMDSKLDPTGALRVIYGHHMNDSWVTKEEGSMFAIVDDYTNADQFNSETPINVYYEYKEVSLKPMACVVGKADAELRNINTADDLRNFAADKTIAQGEISEFSGDLYVLVTCNYWANDNRTYLFCVGEEV